MSFANDLERGVPLRSSSASRSSSTALDSFDKIKDSVSIQIFKINANVKGIEKLVDRLNGGAGVGVRDNLTNLLDTTRDLIKHSTTSIKTLAAFPIPPNEPQRKVLQQKLSREFQTSLGNFQKIQRVAVEKQRGFVEVQKQAVQEEEAHLLDLSGQEGSQQLLQQQQQQQQLQHSIPAHELEFQESQILERETEIREIESGIHELNEIFRDLGSLVVEQGGMIDNIESNITSVATNTSSAAEELTTAHDYQRKAGRRMLWLMLILMVVVGIVLVAILS